MNSLEFSARYGNTLHTDPETDKTYLRIPVTDLSDLGYIYESLLKAVQMLTQMEQPHWLESRDSIHCINKILSGSFPRAELDGLAELREQQNTQTKLRAFDFAQGN